MPDLQLVWTGLLPLMGIVLGALLTTGTQLYLERKRERRAAERAKRLVAGELLQDQLILRTIVKTGNWPCVIDMDAFLPTSSWRDNRSNLAAEVQEDLWSELVTQYAVLEFDRARFALARELPAGTLLPAEVAEALKQSSNELGRLRRKLGVGGGWLDEL